MLDEVAYALADRLGPRWWRVRPREVAIYQRLGVRWFARRFVNGGSRSLVGISFYRRQRGDRGERLDRFDRFARGIEAKHLVGLVLCAAVPAIAWAGDRPRLGAFLALLDVVGHGYPIMSMRYARSRAQALRRPERG